jgi:hypothetical protein
MTTFILRFLLSAISLSLFIACGSQNINNEKTLTDYQDLEKLFKDWREFEKPPLSDGAPDYTKKTFNKRYEEFKGYSARLKQIDYKNWTVSQKVDWHIVRAEMNGFDFNHRILKPWERDPAFYKSIWNYKSDVPAHEGPTHHGAVEVWTYKFPLNKDEEDRLISELSVIIPLNNQAKLNLTGNAKDLWLAGIRTIADQEKSLMTLKHKLGENVGNRLNAVIDDVKISILDFVDWLKQEAKSKTGPSGIGKDNYTWYQQNVHLLPLTWDDEVMILKRELARSRASLKLEEHRNRKLPELKAAASEIEFKNLADRSAKSLMNFLSVQDIVTVKDYFEPALREHLGSFMPKEKRNFFSIGMHYDARPLYSHFYHWFELARMEKEPHKSLIRRKALLYNIFDSRNEGTATAVEEMFMQAGLYDDNPRVREIVYIMIAQRAARGLGSLYAHANMMTMEEAGAIHSELTPRGWMKTEKDLLIFEQHLYLRQPGYGTSYITGKHLLEETMSEYAKLNEEENKEFKLKDFFDKLNQIGNIPISLSKWEMVASKPSFLNQ